METKDILDGNSSWIPEQFDFQYESSSSTEDIRKSYAHIAMELSEHKRLSEDIENAYSKSLYDFMSKSISPPPSSFQFARISNMPDLYNKGIIAWPGIPPGALAKVARENIAPLMIINMRVDDVLKYANHSKNKEPWKPGWDIVPESDSIEIDAAIKRDINDAISFLLNCNTELKTFRDRDAKGLTSFRTFLGALTRDSLTFDGMAIWTDSDAKGRIKAFKALSAQNIRFANEKEGYLGDKSIYAVGIDETGNIKEQFTRNDLIWHVRNPRADPSAYMYGYPEIEMGIRLIQGFQNSIDLNISRFDRNSIPNGMFIFTGQGWVRSQLDRLGRLFINMKRGVTKAWTIPMIMAPKDAKVELLDFTNIKGTEVYYQDFMNMMIGAFCTLYRFPVDRLGYKASGKGPDRVPDIRETGHESQSSDDPGKEPLLCHIEHVVDTIIKTRWPQLRFIFHGKSPREDSREYEFRTLAMTVDERREAAGLPPLSESKFVKKLSKEQKEKLILVGACPVDAALSGVYQVMLTNNNEEKPVGAAFDHKKDPARSEEHGGESGVRRDSAKEEKNSPKSKEI